VVYERRADAPLIDMRVLARRAVWAPNLAGFMVGFGMFGSYILIPQLVQASKDTGYGFGASVTASGLVLLPSSLVMLFTGPLTGRITARFGMRLPLVLGAACSTLAFALLTWEHGSLALIALAGIPLGLGIGLAFAAMANLVIDAVPQDQSGVASAVNTIARSVGGAVGGQIAATLLVTQTLSDGTPAESAYTDSFAVSFAAGIVTLAVCLCVPRPNRGDPPGATARVRVPVAAEPAPSRS
jgi:MFS family permease